MIGKRIGGRYEILRYIGGGGMSRVYLAHDVILDRDVAIKILNYDFSNEEELKRRFLREAMSATSLSHPNIVDIFDVGEDGDHYYLVMEYVDGQTLKDFIVTNGPLSPAQAVPIMEQLVSAISNAHYYGIVHRDIKPQNILMDQNGHVKITDFGIAMALSATTQTKTNSVLGTVHYLSPEQARGGMATKKSDIYALGIVFFELLTGQLPFSGESAVSIALKHLQEETPSVRAMFPSIPQSVENVILKATAKDAYARYESADEMLEDLSSVLSPSRANEEKFVIVFDDEATRAIPIIKPEMMQQEIESTRKHEPVQPVPISEEEQKEEVKVPPTKPKQDKKKRKKWPFFAFGSVLVVLALLFIFVFPDLFGWKKIEVPDVVDYPLEEAEELLKEQGFKIDEVIENTSDEIEEGHVIKTNPQGNRMRPKGTAIKIYVSSGEKTAEVSNYVGEQYERLKSLLENEGFRDVTTKVVHSDEPEGVIIEQYPEAGSEVVMEDTDLILTLSGGKELVTLPNLAGYTAAQLDDFESSSGISISIKGSEYSSSVSEGQVISQKPSKGKKVEKGSIVEVVLSKGKEKQPTKYIIQTVKIPYVVAESEPDNEDEENEEEPTTTKAPQNIRIYVQDRSHSLADIYDEFSITEDTEVTIKIELEEGGRGMYRIMRDNVQIEEKRFDYDDAD